jgi:putative autoinducer-2 (AI-2) aldolase
MDWGLHNRLSRLTNPNTGRTVMLVVDHGYFLGPTTNLEVPRRTIEPLLPHIDSLMLTRGVLRSSVTPVTNVSIVLRVSGGVSILSEDLANEVSPRRSERRSASTRQRLRPRYTSALPTSGRPFSTWAT